jgi:hypothetical protein
MLKGKAGVSLTIKSNAFGPVMLKPDISKESVPELAIMIGLG